MNPASHPLLPTRRNPGVALRIVPNDSLIVELARLKIAAKMVINDDGDKWSLALEMNQDRTVKEQNNLTSAVAQANCKIRMMAFLMRCCSDRVNGRSPYFDTSSEDFHRYSSKEWDGHAFHFSSEGPFARSLSESPAEHGSPSDRTFERISTV